MNAKEFFSSLRERPPLGIYAFSGKEDYLKGEAVRRLKAKLLPQGLEELNFTRLVNPTAQQIIESAETFPLMCDRRLILVQEMELLGKDEKKTKPSSEKEGDDSEKLIAYLKAVPDTACLVFDCGEAPDKRRKLAKALTSLEGYVSFDAMEDSDLFSFLSRQAERAGVTLERPAFDRLVFLCGRDTRNLLNELGKLTAYASGEKRITARMADEIVTRNAEARVFEMIDDAVDGRTAKAYRQLAVLLESGESRIGILALILRQMRQMLYVKELSGGGAARQQIAAALGLRPFVVQKLEERVRRLDTETLKKRLLNCIDTEYAIKNGLLREEPALDNLLLSLSAEGKR